MSLAKDTSPPVIENTSSQKALHSSATLTLCPQLTITGFSPSIGAFAPLNKSMIGHPVSNLPVSFDYLDLSNIARCCRDSGLPLERQLKTPDGGICQCTAAPFHTADSNGACVVFNFRHVTHSPHKLENVHLLVDALPALVAHLDENLCFGFANAVYGEWFGVDPKQLPGRNLKTLLDAEHLRVIEPHCKQALAGKRCRYSYSMEHPDLGPRRLLVTHVPQDEPGIGFYMLAIDMTETDQLEAARVNRTGSMSELAATVAHELKQPLQTIATYASVLRRQFSDCQKADEIEDIAQKLADQTRVAGGILDELRNFVGRRTFDYGEVRINQAIHRVLALTEARIASSGTQVELKLAASLAPTWGSAVQLDQVLVNLVVNAIEAMAECKTPRITIATVQGQQSVDIVVSDCGPGIKADELDNVFKAFHTTKANGMGMGLAISRGLIEEHGGNLWAESNPDSGATFRIRLPIPDDRFGPDAAGQAA